MRRNKIGKKAVQELMTAVLECKCQVLCMDEEPRSLDEIYHEARGKEDGFPVLVYPDKDLVDSIVLALSREILDEDAWTEMVGSGAIDLDCDMIKGLVQKEVLKKGREQLLSCELPDITDRAEAYDQMQAEALEAGDEMWGNDPDSYESGKALTHFEEKMNYGTGKKEDVILAWIPVDQPWKVLGWLPFGGWNECPESRVQQAYAKRWYEKWGAMPAVLGRDTLQFYVDVPVSDKEQAVALAKEQFGFCFEEEDVYANARSLSKSNVWYFWWD